MVRALATKREIDAALHAATDTRPVRTRRTAAPAETARSLQHRLHQAYALQPERHERDLSAFASLAVIVGASGLLWAALAAAIHALL